MLQLYCSLLCSVTVATIELGDVRSNIPAQHSASRHSRRLAKEDFKKTSANLFDFEPHCEQLGARYCDYGPHNLGSGSEFASWHERTQFVYTNMARLDPAAFAKAPYKTTINCAVPKTGIVPYYWSSELTQAARFHSHEMGYYNHYSHATAKENLDLFDGRGGSQFTGAETRILKFWNGPDGHGTAETIAAGQPSPLAVTKGWLGSFGHCRQLFGKHLFLGVGYYYDKNPTGKNGHLRHYWTQNYNGSPEDNTGNKLVKQDIVAGSHDGKRFLVQVHMSQAPSKVSVVIGGTSKAMSLLSGIAKSGTYYVDVDTLTGADKDGCAPYYFEVNSGASRMPEHKAYHFLTYDGKKCKRNIGKGSKPNECNCNFGTPKAGTACTTDGAVMCDSCDSGYSLSNNECKAENVCKCPNGSAKTGADCLADGAVLCASCNSGYRLGDNECKANVKINICKCPNGTPKTRTACTTDGAVMCASCKPGYSLGDNECKADENSVKTNICECPNGTPKIGAACTTDGAVMCASCDSGYQLVDNECALDSDREDSDDNAKAVDGGGATNTVLWSVAAACSTTIMFV